MRALGICAEQAGTRLSHARSHCHTGGTSSTADSVSASLAIGPWPAIIARCFRACKRAVNRLQAQRLKAVCEAGEQSAKQTATTQCLNQIFPRSRWQKFTPHAEL